MNSLNRFRPAKQFRCRPLVGNAPFGYDEILRAADGSHNYQPTDELVGAFSAMNEKGRKEWAKLTAVSEIAGVSLSVSSAGNQSRTGLSICGLATHTNASAHSKFSNAISGN